MRKALILLSILFISGFAYDIEVNMEQNIFVLEQGQGMKTSLYLTNNGPAETFKIYVEGMPPWMFIYPSLVRLSGGETAKIDISFSPRAPPDTYIYTVKILADGGEGEEVWSGNIVLIIKGEKEERKEETAGLRLSAPSEVAPGETLLVKAETNPEALPATLELLVFRGDMVIGKYSQSMSKSSVTIPIKISETEQPGEYTIRGILKGKGVVNSTSFVVKKVEKVNVEKKVETKFLGKKVSIYVENVGNVPVKDSVSTVIAFYERFVMNAQPIPEIERVGGNYRLVWSYDLKPGERMLVGSYSIDYTPYFLVALLFGVAVLIVFQTSKPVDVKKKFEVIHGENETRVKVLLTIVNSSDKEMKGIKVVDKVPAICRPVKFDILQPKVKETKDGYVLEWDLGDMKPGEERVLAYELLLGFGIVGELTLPEPQITLTH